MLLKEIIERIDKSEGNRNCIDFEALAHELDIHFGYTDVDDKDLRLTSYFLSPFDDDGFFCGEALYFFDNEFVAVSCKLSEDTDEEFRWVSREAANTVKNYLLEIDNFEAKLNFCDLKEDHGDGYSISYPDEVIDKTMVMVIQFLIRMKLLIGVKDNIKVKNLNLSKLWGHILMAGLRSELLTVPRSLLTLLKLNFHTIL